MGTVAVIAGVVAEAALSSLLVRPIVRDALHVAPPAPQPLTRTAFLRFYLPLSVTPVMTILAMSIASAAMARMPRPLESLAAWPVVNGLTFLLRSLGFALNEVVVALVGRPQAVPALRRFTIGLAAATTCALGAIALTPLSTLWLAGFTSLEPQLVPLARIGLMIGVLLPGAAVVQSWYQGAIVHSRRTRGVTEAVVIYLATMVAVLGVGRALGNVPGLYVTVAAFALGGVAQTLWLGWRARAVLEDLAHVPVDAPMAPSPEPA